MDSKTKTGAMMGTPAFMPPEQALGYWDEVNERSDLYAVGATMWTLLSGDSVHRSNTVQELLVAACTKQAKPIRNELPHLGEGVANVIDKALRFESDDRWASAKEMLQALRALDGVTDVVKPPTRSSAGASSLVGPMSTLPAGFKTTAAPTTTHSTPGRRRRRGLFAALGAVALLTFAGGYFVTMSREASVAPVAAPTAVTAEAPPVQPSPAAPARTTAAPAVSVAPSAPPAASSAALPKPVARPKPTTVAPKPSAAKPKCDDMFDPRCL